MKKKTIIFEKNKVMNPLVHYNYLKMTFACWKNYSINLVKKIEKIEKDKKLNEYFEKESESSEENSDNSVDIAKVVNSIFPSIALKH